MYVSRIACYISLFHATPHALSLFHGFVGLQREFKSEVNLLEGKKKKEEKYKFSNIDNYQVQNECPTSKLLPTAFIIKHRDLMIHLSKLTLMYSPLK